MRPKHSTHSLAALLEEVADALRQLPDIPVADLRPRLEKKGQVVDMSDIQRTLPTLSRDEAAKRLAHLEQRELIQLSKDLKVNIGSGRTKQRLLDQLLWHLFDAAQDLERIRTFQEKP